MYSLFIILVGGIGAFFGILILNSQSSLDDTFFLKMPTKPLAAFVLGATGNAGRGIVKALLENPNFDRVTIIGRRKMDIPSVLEHPNYATKFEEKLIDFEDPASYRSTFNGYDVGFCALGIASTGITNEAYYRITHDYVVNTAKMAQAGGCKHFHFISGQSTSKTSWFNWARVKAEVEEELKGMGFDRLSLYRPAGILKDCADPHTKLELVGMTAFKVLDPFHLLSIHSNVLGKVIVQNSFRVLDEKKEETFENGDILKLAKEFDQQEQQQQQQEQQQQ